MDLLSRFPGRRKLFMPVVHVVDNWDAQLACAQVQIAVDGGADGVFLISPDGGGPKLELNNVFDAVRARWPELWIGINYMSMAPDLLSHVPLSCNAVWVDKGIGFSADGSAVTTSDNLVAVLAQRGAVAWA